MTLRFEQGVQKLVQPKVFFRKQSGQECNVNKKRKDS